MAELRLEDIARFTGGALLQGRPDLVFRTFNIDSRRTVPGELFFALVAGRDGHDFVEDARRRGAAGAVVSHPLQVDDPSFGLVLVPDTVAGLQRLAAETLRRQGLRVVGITGSAGKTTTKEFAAELLGGRFRPLRSEGNFNNHLGLALSLLNLQAGHDLAVLEMAMSGPGEIRRLTRVAPPDISVITNVNPVHLAFFGSLEEIAAAKAEILEGTKSGGTAVLNRDDPLVARAAAGWRGRAVWFGRAPESDIRAEDVRPLGFDGWEFVLRYRGERARIVLPFFAEAFIHDFLAAAGVALGLGLSLADIEARVGLLRPMAGRGALLRLPGGINLIDDSYNSNPRALETALRGASRLPAGRRVAVLGDMLELGPRETGFHEEAGRLAARLGWNLLLTVGPLARHLAEAAIGEGMAAEAVLAFASAEEAARSLPSLLRRDDLVLVKGSRGVHLEIVVESLKNIAKES